MINILSKDLVNKIAAGEVVERPASIVKELMENAVDALSSQIIVRISAGGLENITVEDNGIGIEQADLQNLFHTHATSKIASSDDLDSIHTFGFRGEALASIASIADVILVTHAKADAEGSKVIMTDGKKQISAWAANQGTHISVNRLFHNIPARRKYMRSEKTESSYCIKIFQEIALANPDISFVLYKDGKESLRYMASSMDQRVKDIVKVPLLPMSSLYDAQDMQLEAALVSPGSLEGTTAQYLYVNKRPVQSSIVAKAIQEAYKSFLKKELRPSYVIFITIAPHLVDVNVHPRKTEVRFLDPQAIFRIVNTGSVKQFERLTSSEKPYTTFSTDNAYIADEPSSSKVKYDTSFGMKSVVYTAAPNQKKESTSDAISFTKALYEDDFPVALPFASTKFLQLANKFIVFEDNNELVIIDQHAASERVNYEKYMDQFAQRVFDYIVPLFPINCDVNPSDYDFVLDHLDMFATYGLILEDMGNTMVSISQFDSLIPGEKIENVFHDVLEVLRDSSAKDPVLLHEKVIASIACRSAIMFGQSLSEDAMRRLIRQLYKCKVPLTCAHGRPVKQSLLFDDLLKKFARC